ncbi:uncharacterized protein N7473_013169 [Penicillium subrubescens]|uniref:Geranylgeranyl pyrophosphate synthetase n=1 Tax=Penicillium subrubescens TaxID=1316194 RepID=A0A1Q5UDC8_9EURO|nr:uncharacterized protein N7473_013169 [Penicillium subrubescens]KAJ5873610.1 hypothetical protein N7473_013169 [Penicillium subrubescens]OKP10473.1 hypothetical protein PENSUB_4105 [Penicillium subrubescens]
MDQRGRKNGPYHGRDGGRWRAHGGTRRRTVLATLPPPLGEIVATIQLEDIDDSESQGDKRAQITNSQYLTSYNWITGADHHIVVPGEPPAWTPLPEHIQLREDSGQYYHDANAARYPTYPLEPMIQAILTERPEFPLSKVDIIGCGSTLGNLLRFARGKAPSFRMLVEVVGNTVFFIRRENSPNETIPDVRGYGHTFPEAYTTWSAGVRGSESHQRLVNYDFAGMKCVVRFEVDGFLPDLIPEDLKVQKNHPSETGDVKVDDILSSIQGVVISSVRSASKDATVKALKVSKRGHYIPQQAVFDLKTRSVKRMNVQTLEEELPRLWIRQIPNFVLAYHTFGKFNDIRVQDVREELKLWEASQQPSLARFASLLHMVVSFARSVDNGKFEIEHEEGEKILNIREPGGIVKSVLPTTLASKWDFEDMSEVNS